MLFAGAASGFAPTLIVGNVGGGPPENRFTASESRCYRSFDTSTRRQEGGFVTVLIQRPTTFDLTRLRVRTGVQITL
ncbi:hypothetical protein ACWDUL_11740 [Nocardia niigatensis]|uniref:hypothetical protein n=1 Tax=Nocardia niigatensis TaxID=209249 RepID=UPI0005925F26|nr:hypothetical protein [Nocardia niigatensis]